MRLTKSHQLKGFHESWDSRIIEPFGKPRDASLLLQSLRLDHGVIAPQIRRFTSPKMHEETSPCHRGIDLPFHHRPSHRPLRSNRTDSEHRTHRASRRQVPSSGHHMRHMSLGPRAGCEMGGTPSGGAKAGGRINGPKERLERTLSSSLIISQVV